MTPYRQAHPVSEVPDSARSDMTAIALAIVVLLVIAALCSILPPVLV